MDYYNEVAGRTKKAKPTWAQGLAQIARNLLNHGTKEVGDKRSAQKILIRERVIEFLDRGKHGGSSGGTSRSN